MSTWVAFLRGVNVGGHHRLPMAELRRSVDSLGFGSVTTHLQSGNLVFTCEVDVEATIVDRLRTVLAERHGLTVPVVVRAGDELLGLADRHPFAEEGIAPKLLHIGFLDREPDVSAGPDPHQWHPDRWAVAGRELFLAYPGGSGRSKMGIEQFERAWGVTATARNLNTVDAVAEIVARIRSGAPAAEVRPDRVSDRW